MPHDHEQKPQIDILVDDEHAEPVKILVDPGNVADETDLRAEVAQVAGSIDAVVDSGVFVHWVDADELQPIKSPEPEESLDPVDGYDAMFAADSALDDGAGVPMPEAEDDHGDGDEGAPNPADAMGEYDEVNPGRDKEEEQDDDEEGPPPSDDDDKNKGPDVL